MITEKVDLMNSGLIPVFSGTYYTLWEVHDTNEAGTEEYECEYDGKEMLRSIVKAYERNKERVLEVLQAHAPWIIDIEFTGAWSPKEYNFATDELDVILTINRPQMLRAFLEVRNTKEFQDYLWEHFRHRDGFMSSTPSTVGILAGELAERGNEYQQSIAALFKYNLDREALKELELSMYYDWVENGYYGLEYTPILEDHA